MKKIAIIGAGVAGLTTSYLLSKKYEVKLFEKNNYFGGHTNTVDISKYNSPLRVDTGFIVLNDQTYPNLHKLFKNLNVEIRNTDMSFGYYEQDTEFSYSGRSLSALFSTKSNLVSPSFYKFLYEIIRFSKNALKDLENNSNLDSTIGDYVYNYKYSYDLVHSYLLPISAAIWSTHTTELLGFPTETLLHFFKNHGLLKIFGRPQWQTVVNGSKSYVEKILEKIGNLAICNAPVTSVIRNNTGVEIITDKSEQFDYVVFATHADEVLKILKSPSKLEHELFSAWEYNYNPTTLHTDLNLMPKNTSAYASWNFIKLKNSDRLIVTYDMNNLMGLNTPDRFLVSLNSQDLVDPDKKIIDFDYYHPLYTKESLGSQKRLSEINGKDNIWYCGSYFGYGFHEDAVKSAFEVAKNFDCHI